MDISISGKFVTGVPLKGNEVIYGFSGECASSSFVNESSVSNKGLFQIEL